MKTNKTIVAFHIGRGGKYYNGGHLSFIGCKNLDELIQMNSDLLSCRDRNINGRFCSKYYTDLNGNDIISFKEAKNEVGCLDFDGQYNTFTCDYLENCSQNSLLAILESHEYNSEKLIIEFFELKNEIEFLEDSDNLRDAILNYSGF